MLEFCQSNLRAHRRLIMTTLFTVLLAGCGGGGGGSSSDSSSSSTTASTTPPPTTVAFSVNDATRLADQAAFGPTPALVAQINKEGSAWIDEQIAMPPTGYPAIAAVNNNSSVTCPAVGAVPNCFRDNYTAFPIQRVFFMNALTGSDQLRQRVALAYSQIFVVSSNTISPTYALREYHQMLLNDAFVTYRQLLQDVTLSPAMGQYLNMANNNKGNPASGVTPNENYAREILQLFSIGVNKLNADGTTVLQGGQPVPNYTQATIEGFASVFTGWTYPTAPGAAGQNNNPGYYIGELAPIQRNHDTTAKTILGGVTIAANGTAQSDLSKALDNIANHPNVGPFIGKQLIQFLVTSNPSPAYVGRVSAVFADDGKGTRGNMGAVIKAILLDPEARGDSKEDLQYGHLREPVVDAVSVLRALDAKSDGEYPINIAANEGETLFGAGSVFNFYSPSNPLPASTTLLAPQFGILNTSSAIARLNFLNQIVFSKTGIAPDNSVIGATGTQINLSSYAALAGNASKLIAQFNSQLLHNTLTPAEESSIAAAVNAIPATDTTDRTTAAAYLILASPRYQIVR